jgi:hypothetical protein
MLAPLKVSGDDNIHSWGTICEARNHVAGGVPVCREIYVLPWLSSPESTYCGMLTFAWEHETSDQLY